MAAAVASERPRRTITGEAWRSAIVPKISGETKAASAEVAKANGLIACRPWASSTLLNGTNHRPSAAPWRKKSAINTAYSALRIVLSTRTEHMDGGGIQAPSGSGDRLASKPWEALASIQPWYSHRR